MYLNQDQHEDGFESGNSWNSFGNYAANFTSDCDDGHNEVAETSSTVTAAIAIGNNW